MQYKFSEEMPKLRTFRSELRMEEEVYQGQADWAAYMPESLQGIATPQVFTTERVTVGEDSKTRVTETTMVESKTTKVIHMGKQGAVQVLPGDQVDFGARRTEYVTPETVQRERSEVARSVTVKSGEGFPRQAIQTLIQVVSGSTVPKSQLLHSTPFTHPITGCRLTLPQAIEEGLIDIQSGSFIDPSTGRRMSLLEAVRMRYLDRDFASQLSLSSDLKDPRTKRNMSILEAIQRGYLDPNQGMIKDPRTGAELKTSEAQAQGLISEKTAEKLSHARILTKSTTHTKGHLNASNLSQTDVVLSLYDTITKGVYNPRTGHLTDPISGEAISIAQALERKTLDGNVIEVVQPVTKERMTLKSAIRTRLIDPEQGVFRIPHCNKSHNLEEALEMQYIVKPLSLHAAMVEGYLDESGQVTDMQTDQKMTLVRAIEQGIVNTDIKCLLDRYSRESFSLSEAMDRGLINSRGDFVHPQTHVVMSVHEALNTGVAQLITDDIDFAPKDVIDTKTGERLTLREAFHCGLLDSKAAMFMDKQSGRSLPLDEAIRKGLITEQLVDLLRSDCGLTDTRGNSVGVLEAIRSGTFNIHEGTMTDSRSQQTITIQTATETGVYIMHIVINVKVRVKIMRWNIFDDYAKFFCF